MISSTCQSKVNLQDTMRINHNQKKKEKQAKEPADWVEVK